MLSDQSVSGDLFAVIGAAATALVAWFAVPKGLYELLALWRDRDYRRAKRAVEFAKDFPDEPAFREHARRLISTAMVGVSGLTHEQRMAFLAHEDAQTQTRHFKELRRWLMIKISAGRIEWMWRRAELADLQRYKRERWKFFGAYLFWFVVAFSPLVAWRMFFGPIQPPLPVLAVLLLFMTGSLLMAVVQTVYASELRMAERFMSERLSAGR
jgi:hypothetical protein